MASKLYRVNATIIILVFVLDCIVFHCIVFHCICIGLYCIGLYCISLYCIIEGAVVEAADQGVEVADATDAQTPVLDGVSKSSCLLNLSLRFSANAASFNSVTFDSFGGTTAVISVFTVMSIIFIIFTISVIIYIISLVG